LAFGDDEAEEDQEGGESAARRRRRTRGQINGDVPLVKDAVGESVAESFEAFLKGCVPSSDVLILTLLTS
jgi:DNA replication licensing factor MCM6